MCALYRTFLNKFVLLLESENILNKTKCSFNDNQIKNSSQADWLFSLSFSSLLQLTYLISVKGQALTTTAFTIFQIWHVIACFLKAGKQRNLSLKAESETKGEQWNKVKARKIKVNSETRVESNPSCPFSSTLLVGESTNTTQDESKIISCLSKIAILRNKGVI